MFKYRGSVKVCFLLLIIMLISYFVLDDDKSDTFENRTMADFSMVFHPASKDSVVYKETAVERLEEALKDQFFMREPILYGYITTMDFLAKTTSDVIQIYQKPSKREGQYTYEIIGNYIRIGGTNWISSAPVLENLNSNSIKIHTDQIREIHKMYPDIHFYFYFVTQAYDMEWFDDFLGVWGVRTAIQIYVE
ncbi:MAG: hypothetical protein HFI33_11655 [Lachnospiraceae bacterium]|nr:hypothetical protein [Lachnospiraceae bacterium]